MTRPRLTLATPVRSRSLQRLIAALLGAGLCTAAQADNYKPGSGNDPRVRAADYLTEAPQQRYFSAASALLQIQNDHPTEQLAPEYFWKLANDTLSFGMQERAEQIYRDIPADAKDAESVAEARIRLAEFQYQRGYHPEAVESLMSMRDTLPQDQVPDWQGVLARALMAQGNYGEATEVLTDLDNSKRQSPYTRYNLAVSLIKDGRADQGVNVMDRMGRMSVFDEETLSLRDKANVGLGYHFLRTQQGGTAIPIFGRVRSVGPFSNRALLGLGWAYLAPQGSQQKKAALGDEAPDLDAFRNLSTIGAILRPGFLDTDIYKRAGLKPFRLNGASRDEEAALKRALVPWVELMSRDPMDPAVQEAYLAVPFSLDRIGAHVQAKEYYEKAIAALEETRKRIDYAKEQVVSGRMVATILDHDPISEEAGWTWKLYSLPAATETFYLQSLIAENRYQEGLKNLRDVRLLERRLDALSQRLDKLQSADGQPADDVPVSVLFARAKAQAAPAAPRVRPVSPPKLQLVEKMDLAQSIPEVEPDTSAPLALRLAAAPAKFDGINERVGTLRSRIQADKPKLKAAELAQSKILERIALEELAGQRKQTEKYLVEARFALARIYDRTLRPESTSP